MSDERDPYRILGIDPAADLDAITAAYRSLARRHHPDVSPASDAERRMAEINAAWALLRDPRRRAAYDREHVEGAGAFDGRGGSPRRPSPGTGGAPAPVPSAPSATGGRGTVAWRRGPDGEGAAGPPPGRPRGSVLPFGRHIGWSLGEIARVDPGYLQWLAGRPEGAPYLGEIDAILAPLIRTADGRSLLNPEGRAEQRGRRR